MRRDSENFAVLQVTLAHLTHDLLQLADDEILLLEQDEDRWALARQLAKVARELGVPLEMLVDQYAVDEMLTPDPVGNEGSEAYDEPR